MVRGHNRWLDREVPGGNIPKEWYHTARGRKWMGSARRRIAWRKRKRDSREAHGGEGANKRRRGGRAPTEGTKRLGDDEGGRDIVQNEATRRLKGEPSERDWRAEIQEVRLLNNGNGTESGPGGLDDAMTLAELCGHARI